MTVIRRATASCKLLPSSLCRPRGVSPPLERCNRVIWEGSAVSVTAISAGRASAIVVTRKAAPRSGCLAGHRTSGRGPGGKDFHPLPRPTRTRSSRSGISCRPASRKCRIARGRRSRAPFQCRARALPPAADAPGRHALPPKRRSRRTATGWNGRGRATAGRRTISSGFASGQLSARRVPSRISAPGH
jgi:hypothetical protein